ncbi:hypothetical protein [Photobacterium sanguinicancri]|uniref:hypothetical protein n=1 Tax=Photobacterium sanguinicancri TaxID=875932 RepID=UPI003D132C33
MAVNNAFNICGLFIDDDLYQKLEFAVSLENLQVEDYYNEYGDEWHMYVKGIRAAFKKKLRKDFNLSKCTTFTMEVLRESQSVTEYHLNVK